MQKLSKMESFKSFEISKQSMKKLAGGRTKYFTWSDDAIALCQKVIDENTGEDRRRVTAFRFQDNCN